MRHQPRPRHVQLDDGAEAFRRDRLGGREELAAGVVDEDVEPPVALQQAVEESVDRVLLADVEGLVPERPRQARGERLRLGQRLRAPTAADHGRPEAHQLERRLPSQAGARPGDDAHHPLEQTVPKHLRSLRTRAFSHPGPAYSRDPQAYCGTDMSVHVQPQALNGPLAGGSAGAQVAVEPLIAGHLDFPRAAMVDPGGSFKTLRIARAISSSKQAETVPAPAFLIHHPSAGPVLVDTGLHPSIASGGQENFGGLANRFGRPSLEAGEDVPSQLRAKGIEPRQIPTVGMTHLHLDHSSAISEFPESTFVVSAAEWEDAAHGSKPSLNGYRRAPFDLAFDYRTVDFDGEAIGSYATFGRP